MWLRARSHMTSHYSPGSVTTLHDLGGVLGRPSDTFFWALSISWSWLLARLWSGPQICWSIVSTEDLDGFKQVKLPCGRISKNNKLYWISTELEAFMGYAKSDIQVLRHGKRNPSDCDHLFLNFLIGWEMSGCLILRYTRPWKLWMIMSKMSEKVR